MQRESGVSRILGCQLLLPDGRHDEWDDQHVGFTRAGKDTNGAQIRLAIAQPAVNTTTRFLNLRFQIKGWDNVPTCIATFDVALVRYAN